MSLQVLNQLSYHQLPLVVWFMSCLLLNNQDRGKEKHKLPHVVFPWRMPLFFVMYMCNQVSNFTRVHVLDKRLVDRKSTKRLCWMKGKIIRRSSASFRIWNNSIHSQRLWVKHLNFEFTHFCSVRRNSALSVCWS